MHCLLIAQSLVRVCATATPKAQRGAYRKMFLQVLNGTDVVTKGSTTRALTNQGGNGRVTINVRTSQHACDF